MIDKTIPMIGLMFRSDMTDAYEYPDPVLPEGFHFENYNGSEEQKIQWAQIFDSVGLGAGSGEKAVERFNREFCEQEDLAKERVIFIVTDDGKYVGTCTAWQHLHIREGRGTLHWLGVRPEYQKYGLGRALVEKCLYIFKTQLPGLPVYLATQSTSHKAICLYIKKGFYPIYWTEETKANYEKSVEILNGVMREAEYKIFASYARDESNLDKEWAEKQKAQNNK
ncbi:MAG: GNAT family N-acetyltransferase [Clostridia bacterium]|nr:GNAT family N-acetyltransferase [Clostridia bacterium]